MTEATTELSREDMLALIESGRELSAEITLEALLQSILEKAGRLTDSPSTSIILQHQDRAGLYVAAATGDKADWVLATFGEHALQSIPIKGSKAGEVFSTGHSIIENKVEGHFKGVDEETKEVTESMVCVPLGTGPSALGVMQILNKRSGNYDDHDCLLLEHFATQAAVAIKNAQLFESVLAHSGFYMKLADTSKVFETMRDLARPAHLEKLTVLFADMRGFTQLCQSLPSPVAIQQQLNEFISMLADEVIAHDGMVNKFLGDGLMALFRRDNHAERAVKAAFQIVDRFAEMKKRWNDESSEQLDFLDVGMGIVTGEVTIGGIGSDNVRDFTAIGSAVNLAAALEEEARDGKRIIVNHLTYTFVKNTVEAENLGDFLLKKPQQTVGIRHKRYSLKKSSAPMEMKLFVSHTHLDRQVVEEQIVQPLQSLGVKTWYALDDIPKASLWPAEIRKGLAECTCMIVVVSKNASGSDWVRLEVDLAVGLGQMQGKIVPLRLDDTPPHTVNEYLMAVQGIDARTTPNLGPEILKFVQTVSRR
jgi:adenylate cyclase